MNYPYTNFVKKVLNENTFKGCKYKKIYTKDKVDFYLVFSYDKDNDLNCMIAVNTTGATDGFYQDWKLPVAVNGEIIDTTIFDCKGFGELSVLAGVACGLGILQESLRRGRLASGREAVGLENF